MAMKSSSLVPVLLPFAMLSLVLAILTGLVRLGWAIPISETAGQHGALMVGSFLGTVILLERAVVFKNRWALLAPALNGLSLPAFLLGWPVVGLWLLIVGSLGMVLMTYLFLIRYKHPYYYLLFGGSVCLVIGHVLVVKTGFYPLAVPWWIAFLLLTIVAERLELSRFLPIKSWQRLLLWGAIGVFLIGIAKPFHGTGQGITGVAMIAVAAWLLRFDMAVKSLRKAGQPRYSGTMLLLGYGWLMLSGLLFALPIVFPFVYDATLHTFFAGFVFSMIFAHAPIILPGVLGRQGVFYHPILYVGSVGQLLGLLIRTLGDWQGDSVCRMAGGLMQGIAIGIFLICMLVIIVRKRLYFPY
ncbi:hypothetical protein GO730_38015 [Spirosoma sp. HMF3257]|uniref:NnrS family protein n=2 Tax=Spirosoma telluris TaxID=2183553 RepID=A0A327NGU3_9BACT|nr:hypothetical protein [Spirosoma telluris]RAI73166.1 hypothetical protein HMF3257_37915 [Spirosoma telluris]